MRVQGTRANEIEQSYWMRAMNQTPWPLDEGRRPKSGKSKLNLHGIIVKGKSFGSNPQKKRVKRDIAHDLKNQDAS
jgi:hypothetical protein